MPKLHAPTRGTARAQHNAVQRMPFALSTALSRPTVGPYTWDDFVDLPDDDRRELIDGELVEVEVPGFKHERLVITLGHFLYEYVTAHGGVVVASGYKVRISETRGVMPDLQLFRRGNEPGKDQDRGLAKGHPDLAIEILSPSSRRYDRILKLAYYASIRVSEYWIVDPEAEMIDRLTYTPKGYVFAEACDREMTLRSSAFPGLEIPLVNVWPSPRERTKKVAKARARTKPPAKKRGAKS